MMAWTAGSFGSTNGRSEEIVRDTRDKRRPRPPWRRAETWFKVIVVLEVAFLVCLWATFPEKIESSLLRQSYLDPQQKRTRNKPYSGIIRRQQEVTLPRRKQGFTFYKNMALHPLHNDCKPDKPTLIIGGSDGSGTRAVVETLKRLGVLIKTDSRETLDVRAPHRSGGWPTLVNKVLNHTHSINYEVDDLSVNTKMKLVRILHVFWRQMQTFRLQRKNVQKTRVFVGFKAPATMVLLPLLKEVIGPIKYLHVVRDGRDIAVSRNQSPVHKFYHSMYTDAEERMKMYSNGYEAVLAMHLWNDWNKQSLQWEQEHAKDSDFEYMVVRSEDLLNPETKLETLARLAAFVGSPLTVTELCELSRTDVVDLGQSKSWGLGNETRSYDNAQEGDVASVHARYGKWKEVLKNSPELSAKLHDEGTKGLKVFGYDPRMNILTLASDSNGIEEYSKALGC